MKLSAWFGLAGTIVMGTAHAASLNVSMSLVNADGTLQAIGTIRISETTYGLLFTPDLKALPAGMHGFHVHENGSCAAGAKDGVKVAALGAGGHFDPQKTGKHLGPYGGGHLGDLPALYVTADGIADYPVLASRLKNLSEIKGRALMIHAGSDNHSDMPKPLGGGGDRVACGVI
ncbi:superoxide dismutase family protein [Pseudomonas chlororaphis]|uniref:Superoxide dismutase [Cu-Zn] n=1 Tax=Pseudomonas chlororaphis TaxID=587753 RepID=A0AAX3FRH0_9PSED|nr:superoxide dismutase family protein [Pseudomonas chlororaphis]AZC38177.1 Superoxide dismutase [Cu-Zn] precursor [Pseudomonas chlororaphis subsp. piscium]AZC44723.1 Superoxide dismutase [Cu-Zn] precursor [Pseudomonas chlororaphis subsp. piscium]WDG70332.1 superoxide dismutase [Cu-Zn] SodC [Pseudomonas chlororaphis]WDH31882.1 superoxide dismutase [Cu-Zn] SodC [Pseudomonas chlororaphis]WDH68858.1 superoxide dismutase [Cu-Zn] SodC [Pseudomonas chlororaphis]